MASKILFVSLTLLAFSSFGSPVDDWSVTVTKTYKNAYTINSSDSELGITCKKVCFYYVNPSINCKKDSEDLTLLLTSSGKTLVVKNRCIQHESAYFYMLDSFDEITSLLKTENKVFLVNDLIRTPKNHAVNHSIEGFDLVIEKYFKTP